jgi:NADH dehydrogenase
VIIGAGFGGLDAARGLAGAAVDVTVVDRNNFHTFQPLLYQVATAGLNDADIAYPVRGYFQKHANIDFHRATVTGVDWDARLVHLDEGDPLPFDHLVVAAGATTTYFDLPGAEQHAFPLYTLEDAIRLRNHILDRFESADVHPELVDEGALTFVVVGGGPTGVETAGALAELFGHVLEKDFHSLDVSKATVVLLEMRDSLLGPFSHPSRQHALDALLERGIDIRLGVRVTEISDREVTLDDGTVLPTHTLIWAAGVRANPLADVLDVEQDKAGRIVVGSDLAVPGRRRGWAIGDIARMDGGKGPDGLAQLAPVAMQSGRHVAAQIRRLEAGQPTRPFRYRDKGTMATIGRRAAVAELPFGIKLTGVLAWLAWLGLHIFFLVGKRNRASVLLNWGWNYVTWDRGPRLIIEPADSVRRHA